MNMEFVNVFRKVTDWDLECDLPVREPPLSAAEMNNHLPNVSVPKKHINNKPTVENRGTFTWR